MPEPTPLLPHVAKQIEALPKSDRPLVICDVDEVILHLIPHLERYLARHDLFFLNHDYKFTGNIAHQANRQRISPEEVRRHLHDFFDQESHRQEMVAGASEALASMAQTHEVLLLTNLPGEHNKPARETLLASYGIPFPVLTNSGPKGGAVAALAAERSGPVVFIDDSPTNHTSVNASLPSAIQIQFIADDRFRANVAPESHIDLLTGSWSETSRFVAATLNT